jgi:hypothetical protein
MQSVWRHGFYYALEWARLAKKDMALVLLIVEENNGWNQRTKHKTQANCRGIVKMQDLF